MNSNVITITNVSKKYHLGEPRKLTEFVGYFLKKRRDNTFWALKDINLEIAKGESVGFIGPNGSGKSTLLKVIGGITIPNKGKVEVKGRSAALLELGTGFHPDLSGRENVFLYGAIMGMTPKEIQAKFSRIVDFSGIKGFIDTPLKHYSSGMRVRLAFSVAIYVNPDVLLIDEALAVGDAEFQTKCRRVFDDFHRKKNTMVIVSHDVTSLRKICDRLVWLDKGQIIMDGRPAVVAKKYL